MHQYFEIFWRFFNLGLISFGGPAAHIGYFQRTFVHDYKWLDMNAYGRLVALSQFLPGPGSSQVGFAIGLERAGIIGGLMAFIGFTLPSFLLMWLLAVVGSHFSDTTTFVGMVYGLKLLAVVIVADAIITMAKSFCKGWLHSTLAVFSSAVLVVIASVEMQLVVLVVAAIVGAVFCSNSTLVNASNEVSATKVYTSHINKLAVITFCILLVGLPLLNTLNPLIDMFDDFYQAGSLVFGGGHVVLPLLQQSVGQLMTDDQFLTGYAAAQAVPGPMFTLASYLGAELYQESKFTGALVATVAIFLPGFLLIIAFHRSWHQIATQPRIAGAMAAVNAAVVGVLLAALYQPISSSAIHSWLDLLVVIIGFVLFKFLKLPVVTMVGAFAAIGVILSL